MRRVLFLTLLTCLFTLAAPAHADDSSASWTAWLHYGRHMTLIDSNGDALREVELPLPEGYNAFYEPWRHSMAVSRKGALIAYVVQAAESTNMIVVYDTIKQQIVTKYALPLLSYATSFAFPSEYIFNENDTALAFGYTTSDFEAEGWDWRISTLSLTSGEILSELSSKDAPMQALGLGLEQRPGVLLYAENEVSFTVDLTELGRSGAPIRSFTWNTLSGEIRENIAYTNLYTETFNPTGEIITKFLDNRFPSERGYNTLHVYDPITQSRFPFYTADVQWASTFFVENGKRILTQNILNDPHDILWSLIDRDGTLVDTWQFPRTMRPVSLRGIPDGFIYSIGFDGDVSLGLSIPALYKVNTRDGLNSGRVIWQLKFSEYNKLSAIDNVYLDIAWVHSDAPVGPFKPWAQLAEPVYAPTPQPSDVTIAPTLIPTPPPLFYAGQTVRVQTIDGEILNLRAEPTRKSEIVVYIEDDTDLELLEGPVIAEGFHWWRVRLPDGLEGWVVENDGELQTLMPE